MKVFLLLVGLVAICDSRSILDGLPGIGVKGTVDGKKLTNAEVSVGEDGVKVSGRLRDDGAYEVEGDWQDFVLKGDSKGEYHASLNSSDLKINTDFDKASGFKGWQGELNTGVVDVTADGDKVGVGKYNVAADIGIASGKISGDLKDKSAPTNYEGHVGLGIVGNGVVVNGKDVPHKYNALNGIIQADIVADDKNYRDYTGTVWIGPVGFQVEYDNAHTFIYNLLVDMGIMDGANIGGNATYNSGSAMQEYNGEANYGPLHAEVHTGNDKKIGAKVTVQDLGVTAQVERSKEGIYNAGIGYDKGQYGFFAEANANKDQQGYYVSGKANAHFQESSIGDFHLEIEHQRFPQLFSAKSTYQRGPHGISIVGKTNGHFDVSLIVNDQTFSLNL